MLAKILHRPELKKIFTNSGWMMGEQIFRLLVGLAVGIWIARLLGPSKFGELSYAISFTSIFGIVATLGLNRILVRNLVAASAEPEVVNKLMSTVFAMRLVAALAMYTICIAGTLITEDKNLVLIGLIAGGFFFSASDCVELYFQSKMQARATARARLMSFAVATGVRVILLVAKADVMAFAAVTLFEFMAAAFVLQFTYRSIGMRLIFQSVDWKLAKTLLLESWPEIIAGFSGLLFMRLDQIMLQHMVGEKAVGAFAVAARISEIWYFIPIAIVSSAFPKLTEVRKSDPNKYLKMLQILTTGLLLLSYVAVLLANLFAEKIIYLLYGNDYSFSADILIIHVWCGIFLILAQTSGVWIVAEAKVKLNLYRSILGCVINIIANLWLIPLYGGRGAALATLISFVFAFFLFDFLAPSMRHIGWMKIKSLLVIPSIIDLRK